VSGSFGGAERWPVTLGEITLPGYRFTAHTAKMWRFRADDGDRPAAGWGFNIAAGGPVEEPEGDDRHLFDDGVCLYAEDEPVPLPDVADLTGVEFALRRPYRPASGQDYFTFACPAYKRVSKVRIRFLGRDDKRYRIDLSASVHRVFRRPAALRYVGWIKVTRRPAE
jgi:hypothetical protein